MKNLKFVLLLSVVISVEFGSNFLPVIAQISPKIQLTDNPPTTPPTPPPEGGEDSATRGPCENTKLSLKPVLPLIEGDFSGLTLKERPTFWFYVPYQSDSISSGEFVIEDEEGKAVSEMRFKLPKIPGFVSITIPNTEKPLEKNKQYRWKLQLNCTSQSSNEPNFDFKPGLVKRVDIANLETQLQTAKLEERIKLYIGKKIWYDAASDFANNKESREAWFKLLEAVGMEKLKQEPISGEVIIIK